mmetsp:Transcript_29469/g.77262  ORF Transcript_29469/g.77262 Transcript_29469/m.77262 type:complete len:226 (-) Transcript_29469:1883-2560(-)
MHSDVHCCCGIEGGISFGGGLSFFLRVAATCDDTEPLFRRAKAAAPRATTEVGDGILPLSLDVSGTPILADAGRVRLGLAGASAAASAVGVNVVLLSIESGLNVAVTGVANRSTCSTSSGPLAPPPARLTIGVVASAAKTSCCLSSSDCLLAFSASIRFCSSFALRSSISALTVRSLSAIFSMWNSRISARNSCVMGHSDRATLVTSSWSVSCAPRLRISMKRSY